MNNSSKKSMELRALTKTVIQRASASHFSHNQEKIICVNNETKGVLTGYTGLSSFYEQHTNDLKLFV